MAEETKDVELLELVSIIGFDGNASKGLHVHPDGEHIIYPLGNKIAIQNLKKKTQRFFEGNTNVISAVAVSKSGKYVASGQVNFMGFRAPVIVWSYETGEIVLKHETHKVRVENVLFTSCENFIMSLGGRDDSNIVVFDIHSKEAICGTFSSNKNAGDAITLGAMHLRGICFATGGVSTLKVWTLNPKEKSVRGMDVLMGKIRRKINCIEIEETDTYAYCGTSTGDIMKVKLNFSRDLNVDDPVAPPALISCYAKIPRRKPKPGQLPSPDLWPLGVRQILLLQESKMLVGAGDGSLDLVLESSPNFDLGPTKSEKLSVPTLPLFQVLKSAKVKDQITSIRLLNDKVLVGTIRCEMFLVNMNTFEVQLLQTCHTSTIYALAFPSDYSNVFATAGKNEVRVWNVAKGRELLRITVPNFTCSGLTFTYDGRVIITSWNDGNIRAFTPQTGKHIFSILNAHNKGVSALSITRDGKKIVSGGGEGQVRIWDIKLQKQTLITVLKEHKGPVSSICISSNDKEAASASTDGTCIIWDLEKFVRIAILFSSTLFMCVQYHPNYPQLLTCGTNRMIAYWEVFDGSLIREVEGSTSTALNTLDISQDGENFVTGGNDQYVKVWKYVEGFTTHIGTGHAGVITAVKISPDMRTIVSCSADGGIFIWKAPFGAEEKKSKPTESEKKSKEELIKKISPTQNVQATSPPASAMNSARDAKTIEDPAPRNDASGDGPLSGKASPVEGGSIKCYCKGSCTCKADELPSRPPSPAPKTSK